MGGLTIKPDFTYANAPRTDVLVVPGGDFSKLGKADLRWIRKSADEAEITMSVCFGALLLARAGLLDDVPATTHHFAIGALHSEAPKCHILPGKRYVNGGKIVTTAGVTAGIDGAIARTGTTPRQGVSPLGRRGMDGTSSSNCRSISPTGWHLVQRESYAADHWSIHRPGAYDLGEVLIRGRIDSQSTPWNTGSSIWRISSSPMYGHMASTQAVSRCELIGSTLTSWCLPLEAIRSAGYGREPRHRLGRFIPCGIDCAITLDHDHLGDAETWRRSGRFLIGAPMTDARSGANRPSKPSNRRAGR